MKSPTAITALYGINASLFFVLSNDRFDVYIVRFCNIICINSPVRASNVISFIVPSFFPSFVTTCFPNNVLNGFLSMFDLDINCL
jgi:hypothetical protein